MFAEMESFAKAVLGYCSKNLAARADSSAVAGGGSAHASDEPAIINVLGAEQGDPGEGGGSGESKGAEERVRRPRSRRPQEEELCAVIAEQWRLTAATLTRSRCVKGNGDAEAMERREVGRRVLLVALSGVDLAGPLSCPCAQATRLRPYSLSFLVSLWSPYGRCLGCCGRWVPGVGRCVPLASGRVMPRGPTLSKYGRHTRPREKRELLLPLACLALSAQTPTSWTCLQDGVSRTTERG